MDGVGGVWGGDGDGRRKAVQGSFHYRNHFVITPSLSDMVPILSNHRLLLLVMCCALYSKKSQSTTHSVKVSFSFSLDFQSIFKI